MIKQCHGRHDGDAGGPAFELSLTSARHAGAGRPKAKVTAHRVLTRPQAVLDSLQPSGLLKPACTVRPAVQTGGFFQRLSKAA